MGIVLLMVSLINSFQEMIAMVQSAPMVIQALPAAGIASEYAEQAGLRILQPIIQILTGEALLLEGELERAVVSAHAGLDLARELEIPKQEGLALRVLGEHARVTRQFPRAERFLQEGLEILRTAEQEYEVAMVQLSLARLYADQSLNEQAAAQLDLAEATFSEVQDLLALGDIQALRETILKGNGA